MLHIHLWTSSGTRRPAWTWPCLESPAQSLRADPAAALLAGRFTHRKTHLSSHSCLNKHMRSDCRLWQCVGCDVATQVRGQSVYKSECTRLLRGDWVSNQHMLGSVGLCCARDRVHARQPCLQSVQSSTRCADAPACNTQSIMMHQQNPKAANVQCCATTPHVQCTEGGCRASRLLGTDKLLCSPKLARTAFKLVLRHSRPYSQHLVSWRKLRQI